MIIHPISGRIVAFFVVVTLLIAPLLSLASFAPRAHGLQDATATLTEWTIPTANSLPAGLALDPLGNCCWFVESSGNKVVQLDPSTDTFHEWAIPTPNSEPTDLALIMISDSLAAFGTEYAADKVFVFFPSSGLFREYTLPTKGSGSERVSIQPAGTDIRMWFTELGVASNRYTRNSIGEITYDSKSGIARLAELTLPAAAGGGPNDVGTAAGIIWVVGNNAIVKWDRATSQFTTWTLPSHPSTQGVSITVDEFGQVWYGSGSPSETGTNNYVGVLRADNTITEWQVSTIGADVRTISINPLTHNPWITERGGDKIAELDPSSGGTVTHPSQKATRFEPLPGGLFTRVTGSVLPSTVEVTPRVTTVEMSVLDQFTEWAIAGGSRPNDIVVDGSGDVWLLESSANKVARLSLKTDFIIECDPSSFMIVQNANGTSTCSVTSIDGFSSAVELSGSWVGTGPAGVSHTLPSPVTPPPGRSVSSTLIVSAGPRASIATFTFQVTARSGSFTHNANLTVTIAAGTADFAIMLSPSLVSVVPGGSATSTITVQSLGVFFSPVQLVSSGAPDGMTLVFAANPVTPPIGGIASSTLSVIASGAPEGTYTITVIGTGGSLTRDSVLTVQVAGGCLIATATYGSELSREVQFLRNFRDRLILKTNTGSSFMVAFNAWYYSFSPTVARLIREHSVAKATTRLALYPLIGILRIGVAAFDVLATYPEAGVVLSGLVISALLGMAYFAIPLTALLAFSSTARRISRQLRVPALLVLLGALVTVAFNGAIGGPAALMTIATSTVVLACLVTSTFFASHALLHIVKLR